ncbi:Arginine repressor [Phycisphaerales bacterium]|nr:Arginine repressor [Phycisphaerales bacterium]
MPGKTRRHSRIRELIASRRVHSQEELGALLASEGLHATQGTLSRDLRELGVLKGPEGYSLPGQTPVREQAPRELERAIRERLVSARQAGNLVILRTAPGHASALAVEVDRAQPEGAVGTVAGDDTVFVAAPSPAKAARLTRLLLSLSASN